MFELYLTSEVQVAGCRRGFQIEDKLFMRSFISSPRSEATRIQFFGKLKKVPKMPTRYLSEPPADLFSSTFTFTIAKMECLQD